MTQKAILDFLYTETTNLEAAGLLRRALPLGSPQGPMVTIGGKELLNLASNDYLGLAGHTLVKKAAKAAIDTWGAGAASPPMITGALPLVGELESAVQKLLGHEEALVYPSGYHANTGLFESLFSEKDWLFCDEQLHPSMADGIRLSRARVLSYRSNDMDHLEDRLKRSRSARFRAVVTDAVFALEGSLADLVSICGLAQKYDAIVVVDDAQGLGVLGQGGKGTPAHLDVAERVDIVTGSFGNALGGGSGGFVSGRKDVVGWLRQKSRSYLVSTALPPAAAAAALASLELAATEPEPLAALHERVALARKGLRERGFRVIEGEHPIICVLVGDAVTTQRMADMLFRKGIFAMGFCHPVVPEGAARIRLQITAKHTKKALEAALDTFKEAGRDTKVV